MTKELDLYPLCLELWGPSDDYIGPSVWATVIYEEELQRTIALPDEAVDTAREGSLSLIDGDDYRDKWVGTAIHWSKTT